jgi:hypothetical protein
MNLIYSAVGTYVERWDKDFDRRKIFFPVP